MVATGIRKCTVPVICLEISSRQNSKLHVCCPNSHTKPSRLSSSVLPHNGPTISSMVQDYLSCVSHEVSSVHDQDHCLKRTLCLVQLLLTALPSGHSCCCASHLTQLSQLQHHRRSVRLSGPWHSCSCNTSQQFAVKQFAVKIQVRSRHAINNLA